VLSISGHAVCRNRVSAISGNQLRTNSSHSATGFAGPPGTSPASIAGATYFFTVLRSTPRLVAISLCERPARQ
jgi:nicotinamide mononucleotide (NMN) deamidase PncC